MLDIFVISAKRHSIMARVECISNPPLSLSLTRRSRTFFEMRFTLLAALVSQYAKERT